MKDYLISLKLRSDWLLGQLLNDFKSQVKANYNSYDLKKGCPAIISHSDNVKNCAITLASSCLDGKATDLVKHAFIAAGNEENEHGEEKGTETETENVTEKRKEEQG